MTDQTKDVNVSEKKYEPFRIRSKVECLYVYLDQLRQEQIQHVLDIDYWQKRIIKEINPVSVKNLEIELNSYKDKKRESDTKIRLVRSMIEDEKKKLSSDELNAILKEINPKTDQDMVRNSIDYFIMATLPYEVDLLFWESKLIEATQPEVKLQIETNILPNIKRSIDLNNGGKANAEAYLKTLEQEEKAETTNKIN